MSLVISKYDSSNNHDNWNEFISKSKNSTFLFHRNFMDYHKDTFKDHSLTVYDDKGKIIACLPANEDEKGNIWSHQGLTYGGVVVSPDLKLPIFMNVFKSLLKYYDSIGKVTIFYKAFPRFYNRQQTDEVEYCLFRCNAELYRRDTAIAVDRENRIPYSANIRREAKKAYNNGVRVQESIGFTGFWREVLVPNLRERFSVDPVHSASEIGLLQNRFPENIKLFEAKDSCGVTLAGTVLFLTENVVHCQYISASGAGRKSGALNLLFTTLLDKYFLDKRYFDFGIVNENDGKELNLGLLAWKERMGGRTYSHDFYRIETKMYELL